MITSEDVLKKFGLAYNNETMMPLSIPVSEDWAPCVPGALGDDRKAFAHYLTEWGLTRGAEIGTCGGEFAEVLLQEGHTLTCVDPWVIYEGYPDYKRQRTLDRAYSLAYQRLAPFYGRCFIVKEMSLDAVKHVPDESLDYVFIDANHTFVHVLQDIAAWEKKVKPGGIVSGHDYAPSETHKVVEAVNAYTDVNRIRPWFTVGWGGGYTRTWFWVKE